LLPGCVNSPVQITRLFLRSFALDARAQVLSEHRFILTVWFEEFSKLIRPIPHSNPARTVSISNCSEIRSIRPRGPATYTISHTSLQQKLLALLSCSQQFFAAASGPGGNRLSQHRLWIWLVKLAILTEALHVFPQSHQENVAIVPRLGHDRFPFKFVLIH
jgi:hypothetical protein